MSDAAPPPEPDRVEGAPHPRETVELFGQEAAEAAFLDAFAGGRVHHAWLITGPRGVGKATLAWRIARFLAAGQGEPDMFGAAVPPSLQMAPDHPVWRRAAALAEPAIALCRRGWDDKAKRLKTALTVDEVRKLKAGFALSAPEGGWRAAIVDAADEMNANAANALLKLLEEPPARTVLLLVSHQPARLLPTIRSRCRVLRLPPLAPEDLARALAQAGAETEEAEMLHRLTGGSVGGAIRLIEGGGTELYPEILNLLGTLPRFDRAALAKVAARAAGRGNEAGFEMVTGLTGLALARLARAGAGGGGDLMPAEAALAARLSAAPASARIWAEVQQLSGARAARARALNLDPEEVILDMFGAIEKAAQRALQPAG